MRPYDGALQAYRRRDKTRKTVENVAVFEVWNAAKCGIVEERRIWCLKWT